MDFVNNETTPLSIREAFSGKHLLVTGVTGFVAKVWVTLLLTHVPEVGRLTILVRGRRRQSAETRLREIVETSPALRPLRERHGKDLDVFLAERLEVLEGDLAKPYCGVEPQIARGLMETVDLVVNVAGLTDFAPDPILAVDVNVLGARHVADLTALSPNARLLHVSTSFVAGMVNGRVPETVTPGISPNGTRFDVEAELLAVRSACDTINEREGNSRSAAARKGRVDIGSKRAQALGWPNIYTYTKGLAEHALASRDDIALSIVRPSIVECACDFPFTGWNEGLNTSAPIFWMCSGFTWKVPVSGDICFDVIPVDILARGMTVVAAEQLQDRAAPVYHMSSGDHNRLDYERGLDLTALAIRQGTVTIETGPLLRWLAQQFDVAPSEVPATESAVLPSMSKATKWLRDGLRRFDARKALPSSMPLEQRDAWHNQIQSFGLKVNRVQKLMATVQSLWETYQPFVYEYNYCFVTESIRRSSARLEGEEQALFGWHLERLNWRDYWLNAEAPGLQQWSLPLIRGKSIPVDDGYALSGPLRQTCDRLESSPRSEERTAGVQPSSNQMRNR